MNSVMLLATSTEKELTAACTKVWCFVRHELVLYIYTRYMHAEVSGHAHVPPPTNTGNQSFLHGIRE